MSLAPHHAATEGTLVAGRYALGRVLGEGNFGIVHLADQLFLGERARRVAVKICKHESLVEGQAREILSDAFLLAEAMDAMTDATARSHLAHVYDVGIAPELGNRAFVVMEYVHGTTLAHQFGSREAVPANQLLKWMRQACSALAALHALTPAILHRDLKPDNMLLGVDLCVRIVDFGLAARLLENGVVPGVVGTLAYMAPETTMGHSVAASDVYSIGLMLYEGLTGRLPFEHLVPPPGIPEAAHRLWLNEAKRTCRIAPPSTASNTVTAELDLIVLKCLEFEPAARFANAGELLRALDGCEQVSVWEAARNDANRLQSAGDHDGARHRLKATLARGDLTRKGRYELLVLLARMHESGDPAQAAETYRNAWNLVQDSAVLQTAVERAALLSCVARAYETAGNGYFATTYKRLAAAELVPRSSQP